ncbi:hypothetical protein Tco_1065419 [Tanacetum coccineum]
MHIRKDPSFFFTNRTEAPQGEELGLMKPLSVSSCSCSASSFISDGANLYGARATGVAPVANSMHLHSFGLVAITLHGSFVGKPSTYFSTWSISSGNIDAISAVLGNVEMLAIVIFFSILRHYMGSSWSSGLNIGVPPCKSISLQGTRSKFDLACYCTVAYAVNRFHLFEPLSESDNSLSALEVQGLAF